MKPEQMTEALESAAGKLGVHVRYEVLATAGATTTGGLCRVKGEWWVIIDKRASAAERVAILADALSTFDAGKLQLPVKVRELLEARRATAIPTAARPVS